MIYILYIFLGLFPISFCYSQTEQSEVNKSNFERFNEGADLFIKTNSYYIGEVEGIKFKIYQLQDLYNKKDMAGLRLYGYGKGSLDSPTSEAYLDIDEIDKLIQALDFIKENINQEPPKQDVELLYVSRGGIALKASSIINTANYKKKWTTHFLVKRAVFTLSPKNIEALKSLLLEAKAKF